MTGKLVLLDTNGLVYRAFFALPYFTTSDGRPTNAVYGFANMLLKVLEEEQPDYAAAAFDRPVPTFRHRAYAAYKAQRERMPDDLRPQLALSKEILQALRIPMFEMEGYEAEDVIATLARRAVAEEIDVLIVSGDLDLLQIVRPGIRVMITSRGITETTVYDEAAVRQRFGFAPAQLPDFKALKGDPTDNIPGVPGIGEKSASALVAQFGSVEALLQRLEEAPPRLRERLAAHAAQIRQSKHLATVVEVPLAWSWEELRRHPPDRERLTALFRDLEFKTLLERLGTAPPQAPPQGEYQVVSSPEGLLAEVRQRGEAGVVLVHTPEHPLTATLTGIAVAGREGRARFLPLDGRIPNELAAWLADPSVRKVTGDAKGDYHLLVRQGVRPGGWDFDVALAAYLLNPGKRTHTLQSAAWEYLHWRLEGEGEEALPLRGPQPACRAADALLRLRPLLEERLRERELTGLFQHIEMPLTVVLAEMERAGVKVDIPCLQELDRELVRQIDGLATEIYRLAGMEFNISSPKQLAFVLFQRLQLPALKKTKTGLSTDQEVLEYLAAQHEIAAKVVEYRELVKLKNTYVDVLPRLVDPRTGRVHTTFNQTLAATGRLSSTEPNLQNIPIRTEVGRRIRRAIIPGDGALLLGVDYSQIDLRVLAHITEDPGLLAAFARDDDVHAVTAAEVFNVPRDQVTPDLRRRAKTIVFGVAYGMSEFGLAAQLGIGKAEARQYIERYYARYPQVRAYMTRIVEQARRDGYVTTLLNRRRYLPDLFSRNRVVREAAERTAINTPIQGSSADIIKKAMVEVAREVLPRHPAVRLILQIHDELLFEVPAAQVREAARAIQEVMSQAYPLKVPLKTEARAGPNWRDMTPLSP
ncbi:MAG: DNA polymerase I [Armatimonadota bacterium]|nr:DNA polymerase I [Armatimonadota bacterium]MDR7426397.1 DNA polymerase I [Armatimonadota bacterium]MDR7463969.1 DNA polymerase I [Armatimonadota bacterium]MDR7469528.1 DNA polymerase I [Armatimonadota bacterium]MDR7473464.1 DNA polymerase I [Armatimonadota bacterium]